VYRGSSRSVCLVKTALPARLEALPGGGQADDLEFAPRVARSKQFAGFELGQCVDQFEIERNAGPSFSQASTPRRCTAPLVGPRVNGKK